LAGEYSHEIEYRILGFTASVWPLRPSTLCNNDILFEEIGCDIVVNAAAKVLRQGQSRLVVGDFGGRRQFRTVSCNSRGYKN